MPTKQQEEALLYFKQRAEEWKSKALSADQRLVNVIQQRNGFVLEVIKHRVMTQSALDVGCGTGDLVCDLARLGIDATGVDFAEEMIAIARANAEQNNLKNARFHCRSIFEFQLAEHRFDVISANGFVEYISRPELDRFLDLSLQALNPGGSLVLGSRNRLFNIFSINAFTLEEIDSGMAVLLLREAVALASGARLGNLAAMETAPLQSPNAEHLHTGIEVSTRYQFTPAQLSKILQGRGFAVKQIYPIHVHGVPPVFKARHPELHALISNLLQAHSHEHLSLVPYASSFMLHAAKEP